MATFFVLFFAFGDKWVWGSRGHNRDREAEWRNGRGREEGEGNGVQDMQSVG